MNIGLIENLRKKHLAEAWSLPLSFRRDGSTVASLRDAVDAPESFIPVKDLKPENLYRLVVARMAARSRFEYVGVLGHVRSPEQALREIEANSPLGHQLIQAEIDLLLRLSDELTST